MENHVLDEAQQYQSLEVSTLKRNISAITFSGENGLILISVGV
uniref:Uncharacterized protein n=1 Tax=Ciona intestinalis TaxID=7719 RepID=H2XZK2_CIOIN